MYKVVLNEERFERAKKAYEQLKAEDKLVIDFHQGQKLYLEVEVTDVIKSRDLITLLHKPEQIEGSEHLGFRINQIGLNELDTDLTPAIRALEEVLTYLKNQKGGISNGN